MSILSRRTSPAKPQPLPPAPPAWLIRPVDGVGFISIAGSAYRVQEVHYLECDGTPRMLVRLRKPSSDEYQLVPVEGELHCDCPDATYRERATTCKHATAVTELYRQLDREQALKAFLAPDRLGVDYGPAPF